MSDTRAKQLGRDIAKARKAKGLSMHALANAVGMNVAAIHNLENGKVKEPRPAKLAKIAEMLDIRVEDLYSTIGYTVASELPELAPYLRAKYQLSNAEVKQLNGVFSALAEKKSKKGGRRGSSR
jgi:transcriptional regulator with XRE-family HTH domain